MNNIKTETFTVQGVSFKMVKVDGGIFEMGKTLESLRYVQYDEITPHLVALSDFAIGETTVTKELWMAVMGKDQTKPSLAFGANDLNSPMVKVSWNMCQEFIAKLNELTGMAFRMPTEAEWELAARGGWGWVPLFSFDLPRTYLENMLGDSYITYIIRNGLELKNMSSRNYEWCQDWYSNLTDDAQTNPTGPDTGFLRVIRRGCWRHDPRSGHMTYMLYRNGLPINGLNDNTGLRLAL